MLHKLNVSEEVQEVMQTVEGWITEKEGELLYRLAQQCSGKGVIVEIGSWKGRSTLCLAKGSRKGNNVSVYAVDTHTENIIGGSVITFDDFQHNIQRSGMDNIVVPIIKTSTDAAREFQQPVELLFIDGAHEYEAVKADVEWWGAKLVDGGILAIHDTIAWSQWEGPRTFVDTHIFPSHNFKKVSFLDSITFAQKVAQNSFSDRLRNRYTLQIKKLYEFAYYLDVPYPLRKIGEKALSLLH